VTALLRYQAAILFRSYRWVFPLISYVLLISVAGLGGQSTLHETLAQVLATLSDGLDWSAAMLLPVVALLTRSMLTAEPQAARACVAAAAGPRKAQVAVLLVGLAGGAVLALAGAAYDLLTIGGLGKVLHVHPWLLGASVGAGLGKAVICVFVGSAVGTFCNPPVIRHQAVALLSTIAAVLVALVSSISPASAALRGSGAAIQSADWPTGVPFLVAGILLITSWLVSASLAARRGS
jgi:hypothetical protein